jgi:hypothetical protein
MLMALEGERRVQEVARIRPQALLDPISAWRQESFPTPTLATFPDAFRSWWDLPRCYAFNVARLAASEDLVAGKAWIDHSEHQIWLNIIAMNRARHRMTVLAVTLATVHGKTGAFPTPGVMGDDPLGFAGGPDRAGLLYTSGDRDHCALGLDPAFSNEFTTCLRQACGSFSQLPPTTPSFVREDMIALDYGPHPAGDAAATPDGASGQSP